MLANVSEGQRSALNKIAKILKENKGSGVQETLNAEHLGN